MAVQKAFLGLLAGVLALSLAFSTVVVAAENAA